MHETIAIKISQSQTETQTVGDCCLLWQQVTCQHSLSSLTINFSLQLQQWFRLTQERDHFFTVDYKLPTLP